MKKQRGILQFKRGEKPAEFIITPWQTNKYPDGRVTFQMKVLTKKRGDGKYDAVWIEKQKESFLIFCRFKKIVRMRWTGIKTHKELMEILHGVRMNFIEAFKIDAKIASPEEFVIK